MTDTSVTELPWSSVEELPVSNDDEYAHLYDVAEAVAAAQAGIPLRAYCGYLKVPELSTSKPRCPACQEVEKFLNFISRG